MIFVGLDAYAAAGGTVQRDLFSEDRGGWVTDASLLERLVAERMEAAAATIRGEGWRWVAIGQDAQAAAWTMRRVWPSKVALSPEDQARRDELASRHDEVMEEHSQNVDDLPEDVVAELDHIEAGLAALDAKQEVFQPETMARAGVVVTLAVDGSLRVDRGYVRPENEAHREPAMPDEDSCETGDCGSTGTYEHAGETPMRAGTVTPFRPSRALEDKAPSLSAALLAELQAHRTAGLQAAIATQPDLALRVMVHALATNAFAAMARRWPASIAMPLPSPAPTPALQTIRRAKPWPRPSMPGALAGTNGSASWYA